MSFYFFSSWFCLALLLESYVNEANGKYQSTGVSEYLAICAIVKNEPDIVEWIEYHKRMGVEKFYIYDNNSAPPVINLISNYAKEGLVEYKFQANKKYPTSQIFAYNDCFQSY